MLDYEVSVLLLPLIKVIDYCAAWATAT